MRISTESFRIKFRNKVVIPMVKKSLNKRLHNKRFTIISNNCWGGTVYETYNLQKQTPTIGMFIMPQDYVKFLESLEYYLAQPLIFIDPIDSKWKKELEKKSNWGTYLIGKLADIELHMLHYHNEDIALEKWNKRINRIDYEQLIVKFNDQNGCTVDDIRNFLSLSYNNKICFVANPDMKCSSEVILIEQPGDKKHGIDASREPFGKTKYLDLSNYINKLNV